MGQVDDSDAAKVVATLAAAMSEVVALEDHLSIVRSRS